MENAIQPIPSQQLETVTLNAYVANSAAHSFYFREGYHTKSFHFFKSL
ncbi:GNAT family protein [Pontibacter roseus]|nr:hypothetical protein [Pontibacter roseus]